MSFITEEVWAGLLVASLKNVICHLCGNANCGCRHRWEYLVCSHCGMPDSFTTWSREISQCECEAKKKGLMVPLCKDCKIVNNRNEDLCNCRGVPYPDNPWQRVLDYLVPEFKWRREKSQKSHAALINLLHNLNFYEQAQASISGTAKIPTVDQLVAGYGLGKERAIKIVNFLHELRDLEKDLPVLMEDLRSVFEIMKRYHCPVPEGIL
jgi:hypothetical protein